MKFIIILTLSVLSFGLLASTLPNDVNGEFSLIELLTGVLSDPKSIKGIGAVLLAVLLTVQLLKSKFSNMIFKNVNDEVQFLIITLLGVIYSVIFKVTYGDENFNAVIVALISSGGASSLFSALKLVLGRYFPKWFKS